MFLMRHFSVNIRVFRDQVLSAGLCGGDTPLVNDTKVNALP